MISASKKRIELFKELMKHFIDDVERGTHPLQAGWIRAEGPEANMLIKLGLARKGEKGVRLLFDKELQKEFSDSWDDEAEEPRLRLHPSHDDVLPTFLIDYKFPIYFAPML